MAPHQKNRTGGRLILDSLDEIERLTTAYQELIMEVVCKYEGESRHETARRYIRERENQRGQGETQNNLDEGLRGPESATKTDQP